MEARRVSSQWGEACVCTGGEGEGEGEKTEQIWDEGEEAKQSKARTGRAGRTGRTGRESMAKERDGAWRGG